ncbi:hypothetical protein C8R44DRAFT_874990 [Mycena epipterygia]|nr:hypothetical protein C8R44DRAFT_874990 [Mycena epipterygia]
MFPRLAFTLLSLLALAAATPAPIDEKLQPIIASKNNIGFVNPPSASTNAAPGRVLSSVSGAALAAGVAAILL